MSTMLSAAEIRSAIRRLPDTHANLVQLIQAVAAYAGDFRCDGIDAVSEHLDAAVDACDDCYAKEVR